jgi:hypothetical protein
LQDVFEIASARAKDAVEVANHLGTIEAIELAEGLTLTDLAALEELRRLAGRRRNDLELAGVHDY